MKKIFVITVLAWGVSCSHMSNVTKNTSTVIYSTERSPAQTTNNLMNVPGTSYEVLFTDPECRQYNYVNKMNSQNGTPLKGKPKNVYCRNQNDLRTSGSRDSSPQKRLVDWVNDPSTKEILFTYLSFRNRAVKTALCERVKKGDLRVTFVMSSSEDTTIAEELVSCNPSLVQYKTRGLEGDLGYAHNKIFMVLKKQLDLNKEWRKQVGDDDSIGIVFSSGNMTSGPVMHHENWHFVKTKSSTHFAQMHLCALYSEWNDKTGRARVPYMNAISSCRQDLVSKKIYEEDDIKVFFVPGEGEGYNGTLDNGRKGKSAWEYMRGDSKNVGIVNADKIWIGAHRFFYSNMINALTRRMHGNNKPDLRIKVDDDTYYKAMDPNYGVGDTDPAEWYNIEELVNLGAKVRLMETNPDEHQLHHSKYLLFFKGEEPAGLLCGAANLTGAGFKKNWENIYYIKIPGVLNAFAAHYEKFWYPTENVKKYEALTSKATPINGLPEKSLVSEDLDNGE